MLKEGVQKAHTFFNHYSSVNIDVRIKKIGVRAGGTFFLSKAPKNVLDSGRELHRRTLCKAKRYIQIAAGKPPVTYMFCCVINGVDFCMAK